MATKVGPKGQVVIEQHIRDKLGVEPGMLAVQQLVGDHVEVRFVPGPHSRSLAGVLRPFITPRPDLHDPAAFEAAAAEAWAEEASQRYRRTLPAGPEKPRRKPSAT